jgi:Uma2 family endonuclease
MSSSHASHADPELPGVDERLVAPETRYEISDGELVHVSPANYPHGRRHSKLAALLEAHAAEGFEAVSDMLTRASETTDVAPDVSVRPDAPDPETGGRQLEHLAFEVVSTESLSHAGGKAAQLVARGVRRVFAIDIERARVLEWSSSLTAWSLLDTSAHIEDRTLAAPLPIVELLDHARADDAMARALVIKGNPVIEAIKAKSKQEGLAEGKQEGLAEGKQEGLAEGKQEGLAEGKQEGLAEGKQEGLAEGKQEGLAEGKQAGLAEGKLEGRAQAVLEILTARGFSLEPADRMRILAERDPDRLGRWIARASTCTNTTELLVEP